ncbi:MAG: DNA repair protein RadC [Deltaproteobacteria bacterium]|nr:DNA repair protein RadC [Deltaproteobacteria bacterium]
MTVTIPAPHYKEHRKRIKERFSSEGLVPFRDYEVIELMLTYAIAQKDLKPLAKELIARFGSFQAVLEASVEDLQQVKGIGEHAALLIKLFRDAIQYYLRRTIKNLDIISSPADLVKYCTSAMAHLPDEQFRVVYLNAKNQVLADEVVQTGTVDQTAVYPRKIIERALSENAVALVLVHNHPSGSPEPSVHDRSLTASIVSAAATLDIRVHDHIVIGRNGYRSFREEGLLQ